MIQYCLLKTLYDKTGNILECFYPFFLNSLSEESCIKSVIDCQRNIKEKYNLDIPVHVVHSLAHIGFDKKHITIKDKKAIWPISLTEIGIGIKDSLLAKNDSERKINQLISDFSDYLAKKGINEDNEKIRQNIENYIKKNLLKLSDFFFSNSESVRDCFQDHEKEFTQYILEIEKQKPIEYATLKEMFLGSIISSSLNLSQKEFEGIIDSKFKHTKIYFDANYLLSLLGYDADKVAVPAQELYELLIKFGFDLRYFDFTLSEIQHVLSAYKNNYHCYSTKVKVESLYSLLKRKGKTPSDVIDIMANLKNELAKKNILIKDTNVDLNNFCCDNEDVSSKLRGMKKDQHDFYHNHDCALLEKARKLRKNKTYYNFEDAKSFVITSDYKLGKVCYDYFNHHADNSISEIILDRTFTNILFLKDPSMDLSLSTIISGFSSELGVKNSVWKKFYSELKKLKESNSCSDDKLSNLFYHGYIENELINCDSSDIDSINQDFILDKIEDATIQKENDFENVVAESKKEQEESSKEAEIFITSILEDYRKTTVSQNARTLQNIYKKADKEANKIVLAIKLGVIFICLIPVIWVVVKYCKTHIWFTVPITIGGYIIGVIAFIGFKGRLAEKIQECRRKKLKTELFDGIEEV